MDTLTIAHQLADLHPSARLPCPACGVSVNGDNLAKHLAKVHAFLATSGLGARSLITRLVWQGAAS